MHPPGARHHLALPSVWGNGSANVMVSLGFANVPARCMRGYTSRAEQSFHWLGCRLSSPDAVGMIS